MDLLDTELGNRHGPLAVNKASGKIAKGLRRPVIAHPRPPPTLYKIEAGHFRSLVQELTGTTAAAMSGGPSATPKPPGNSRLQKVAPPPLRPVFSYPKFGATQQYSSQQHSNPGSPLQGASNDGQTFNRQVFHNGVHYNAGPLSPSTARNYNNTPLQALLSPRAFSHVPTLSPSDQMWVNALESPTSTAMRQLAQNMNSTNENPSNGVRRSISSENLPDGVRHLVPTTSVAQLVENAMMRHSMQQPVNPALHENQAMRSFTHSSNDNQRRLQSAQTMVASANETLALRYFAHSMSATHADTQGVVDVRWQERDRSNTGAGLAQTVFSSNFSLSPRSLQILSALGQNYH